MMMMESVPGIYGGMQIIIDGKPNQKFQEFVERCLSVLWDQYREYDCFPDDVQYMLEDMGITEDEAVEMFRVLGYGEED